MAVPAVVAVGAVASGTTTITPALPAGAAAGHLLVTLAESVGNQVFTLPTGWNHFLNAPVNLDTTTRLTVIYRRMVGGDTAPAIALPGGNHAVGRMIAISGVIATGNPWDVAPSPATESVADTSATWNAVTTTQVDCLMLFCIATGRDANSTANMGALTGGTGLTSITERMDNWISTGTGGGIGLVTAEKLTAGSTGTPGATMGDTTGKALLTVALAPAPAPINLTVQNGAHAQAADSPALTQVHALTVQSATQAQSVDTVALTQTYQLVVADALQAQTADSPTVEAISAAPPLAPAMAAIPAYRERQGFRQWPI